MLKKSNAGRTGGSGGSVQAEMRLLKVLDVAKEGLVVEFVDGKEGPSTVFMEAMPSFVAQKNASPNYAKKQTGDKMDPLFYQALMRPTSNPEHQFQKNKDIISAKVFPRQGVATHASYGELTKVGLGGGFTIFARGDTEKKDPFDDNVVKPVRGDLIIQGMGRIVHDPKAENKQSGKTGTSWIEVLTERKNPTDLNALFDEVRDLVQQKRGKNIFLRIVDEKGENDSQVSFYPGKDLKMVEDEIEEIKNLSVPLDRIFTWDIHPRIYLREEFMLSVNGENNSKLDRFRKDAEYVYKVDRSKTPYEVEAVDVTRGGVTRRVPGDGYFIPVAVSQTLYQNATTGEEWLPGAIRALIPTGSIPVHSRQSFMTPAQRALAATLQPETTMDDAPMAPDAGNAPSGAGNSTSTASAPAADLDFGFAE